MKDRERILELVKKGILSTEEALVLLESMAVEKDTKQIQKAAEQVSEKKNLFERPVTPKVPAEPVAPVPPAGPAAPEEPQAAAAAKGAEEAEKAQSAADILARREAERDARRDARDAREEQREAREEQREARVDERGAREDARDARQDARDARQEARQAELEARGEGAAPTAEELAQAQADAEQAARDQEEARLDNEQERLDADQADRDDEQADRDDAEADRDDEEEQRDEEQVERAEEAAEEERQAREERLADLANKANAASAELDNVSEEIAELTAEIKNQVEAKQVYDTMEELGTLTESKVAERKAVVENLNNLEDRLSLLKIREAELEQQLKGINKERFNYAKERITQKFEIPEDWKNQTKETFEQVGGKVQEASSQFGGFLKKTISSVIDAVNDNVDWKDVNIKVPGMASTKFSHIFNYPEVGASIIDIKLANGQVVFKESDNDDLHVEANIKLYGKMEAETPLQAFLEKSQIDVDDDVISFQIPNKRIKADLVFYLPKKVYDHVSLKLLNGDILVGTLQAKDIYAKSTNGDVRFSNVNASMLEINGVNGDIEVLGGKLLDLAIESVNGDIVFKNTDFSSANAKLVNGDIRGTATSAGFTTLIAGSVNGDVKIAIPSSLGLEGTAKTNLGSVQQRLSDVEILTARGSSMLNSSAKKGNQVIEFRRVNQAGVAKVEIKTTTGDIFLKDTDQK